MCDRYAGWRQQETHHDHGDERGDEERVPGTEKPRSIPAIEQRAGLHWHDHGSNTQDLIEHESGPSAAEAANGVPPRIDFRLGTM